MLDVLLINPNYRQIKEKKFIFHIPVQKYPPLGLAYLASSLASNKLSVEILDASALNLNEKKVAKYVREKLPKIIGISSTSFSLPIVYKTVKKIEKEYNSIFIVGGTHITHSPSTVDTLDVDFGLMGDAEKSLVDFVKNLKKNVEKTSGLVYKKNGKLILNPHSKIRNLDSLAFPSRKILPNEKYYSPLHEGLVTTMITSRGCPFDCVFCGLPNRKLYRERSAQNVVGELREIVKMGFRYLEIEDDCFTINRKRIIEICTLILQKKIRIEWGCETRADMVDEKLLRLMKKAGCRNIRFGIESGDEVLRKINIGKNISDKKIIETFKLMRKVGLETVAYFMFGHPGETIENMEKTLEFSIDLEPDFVDFHLAVPIPGSRLFSIALNEGKIRSDVWDEFALNKTGIPVYTPKELSVKEMSRMQKKAYRAFYIRLSKISKLCEGKLFPKRLKAGISLIKNVGVG